MSPVIPPTPGPLDAAFWEGIAKRKLLLRRCAGCATLQHPPTPMCGSCHGLVWEDQEATGRGTVYTWIVSHHPSEPDASPRIVVLVELEEGVRLVSNLQGIAPEDVRNDLPVELTFLELEGGLMLPQFVPAAGGR